MKTILFLMFALTAPLMADAPTYGTIVIDGNKVKIYEGASKNSKVAGYATDGEEFVLRAEKTYKGFYKIQYEGHICFIGEGDAVFNPPVASKAQPTEIPVPKSGKTATIEPTVEPGDEATLVPTRMPQRVPTEGPEGDPTQAPTRVPSRAPTVEAEPELKPTANVNQEPTRIPTEELFEEATAQPTAVPTAAPRQLPIEEPTAVPTRAPQQPTAVPVIQPTSVPTASPRQVQGRQLREIQKVVKDVVRAQKVYQDLKGKVVVQPQRKQTKTVIHAAPRAKAAPGPDRRGQLSRMMFYVPLGAGKPYDVKPAFKPDAAALDSRNIDSSGFVGFGLEGRTWPWLRIFGDWTTFAHRTVAANSLTAAPTVDLPGGGSILSSTDIQYNMGTHGFRAGLKLGVPIGGWMEPWVGGGAGLYLWKAEYRDLKGYYSYGSDQGAEFGWTAAAGIDFNVRAGSVIFMFTPFYEYGAPVVYPTVQDIAGLGVTWHDTQGTAVMVPRRLGMKLGLGF